MQVVTRRTGLGADLLRAWEKRYRAVRPGRSEGGHRLYSDEDIAKLLLLRRAVGAGRSIGRIANLNSHQLEELVAADAQAPDASLRPRGESAENHLRECLTAVEQLDTAALESALLRASLMMSSGSVVRSVLVPLMTTIGERWRLGELRIVHEHLATSVVRSFLGVLARGQGFSERAPRLISATPSGQMHEMGALMVAAAAIPAGWNATYLGASLPAEEIASGALQTRSRLVALSIVYPFDDPRLPSELNRLRELLAPGVRIVAGGGAAAAYRKALLEVGGELLDGIDDLESALVQARDTV